MTFGIDLVVLVGQVLELDGAVHQQLVLGRSFEIAARLLVARVGLARRPLHLGQHERGMRILPVVHAGFVIGPLYQT